MKVLGKKSRTARLKLLAMTVCLNRSCKHENEIKSGTWFKQIHISEYMRHSMDRCIFSNIL
jgi:hypothetical protein